MGMDKMLKSMIGASAGDLGKVLETLVNNQDEQIVILNKILQQLKLNEEMSIQINNCLVDIRNLLLYEMDKHNTGESKDNERETRSSF